MNALFTGHSHKTLEELMGDVRIFDTHGADSQLNERSGQKVLILRELTPDECDIEEVGKMYHVRFLDGFECDAFEDELIDINIKKERLAMTEREKYLFRQGVIQLLDNAYTAYKLVNCKPAEDEINKYIKELQELLNKI